ncbi:sulfate adenylyltransferase [Diaphorobacter ruginosibacter]|uniref:sulfate adenylyltransferase n=1 Tax=Diaphorobacter ruginosibacter TaxID=1715720 RepID=A0A7G9RIR6_9BURK|nr:GTP-binding protein [Diaphorobacter ruginosibacter]QNN55491.1 sulfate adenylyltransferase [Diaphorobacter ruginosibacter]
MSTETIERTPPQEAVTTQHHQPQDSALRFITCGSVDDGKSTLIGRLLVDTRAVLQDQFAGITKSGETDLALLTDGLSAEREQGITIDVAYRYFSTEQRKFIIGDAPGHEQYTRNMVTAASSADAAIVLVDATKLDWKNPELDLLVQTRRHALLANLLRVPSLIFAVNKLDAVEEPALAFAHIRKQLAAFAYAAGITVRATVPVSALKGYNVVDAKAGWAGYEGPSLLQVLHTLPSTPADRDLPLAFPVQWVEKFSSSADTSQGRRVFWGRVAAGEARPGQQVTLLPSNQTATIAQVLDTVRTPSSVEAGNSAGIVLDREVDVSRGDWIVASVENTDAADDEFDDAPATQPAWPGQREVQATVAWMDDEPLVPGRVYLAQHGHRWIKAKVRRVVHRLNINTLAEEDADRLEANAIGHIELLLQEPAPVGAFQQARVLGSLILVDTASHKTAGAVLVRS